VRKVVVVKEVRANKCDNCDKYGHLSKVDSSGTTYSPYCDCEFGRMMNEMDDGLDMFSRGRRGQ